MKFLEVTGIICDENGDSRGGIYLENFFINVDLIAGIQDHRIWFKESDLLKINGRYLKDIKLKHTSDLQLLIEK